MTEWFILKSGIIFNLIGAILIAFSVRPNPEGAYQPYKGRDVPLASILYPKLFRWGIAILVIGFVLSIFDIKTIESLIAHYAN